MCLRYINRSPPDGIIWTRNLIEVISSSPNAIASFILLLIPATEDRNIKDVSLNNEDWSEAAKLAAFGQSLTE
jgi:hypothetical protein